MNYILEMRELKNKSMRKKERKKEKKRSKLNIRTHIQQQNLKIIIAN